MLDPDEQAEATAAEVQKAAAKAAKLDRERDSVLEAVSSSETRTMEQRVAWLLNYYPDTRNSDITLLLKFWSTFHSGEYTEGTSISPEQLYSLTRLNSLTRARAHVQNTLKLFQADAQVQHRRRTLSSEKRDKEAAARSASKPVYTVFVDESGKTGQHILVGSLWILQAMESLTIGRKLQEWRKQTKFREELHFKKVDAKTLPYYKQAIEIVLATASAISFKYIALPRHGAGHIQDVIAKLIYHLVVRGIEHEHRSGRACLPRMLSLWKDAEEKGYDQLVIADLRDRLKTAASAQFNGDLVVDTLEPIDSRENGLLQIVDLVTGSINRAINPPDPAPRAPTPKDDLSRYVIDRMKIRLVTEPNDQYEDMAVRIDLGEPGAP